MKKKSLSDIAVEVSDERTKLFRILYVLIKRAGGSVELKFTEGEEAMKHLAEHPSTLDFSPRGDRLIISIKEKGKDNVTHQS